jgi:hypothetical protein
LAFAASFAATASAFAFAVGTSMRPATRDFSVIFCLGFHVRVIFILMIYASHAWPRRIATKL